MLRLAVPLAALVAALVAAPAAAQHTVTSTASTCPPIPNATGVPGVLDGSGAFPTLDLTLDRLPMNQTCQVLSAPNECNPPLPIQNSGILCACARPGMGEMICRGEVFDSGSGTAAVQVDLQNPNLTPCWDPPGMMVGETFHFQVWHREPAGAAQGSNFTNGIEVVIG